MDRSHMKCWLWKILWVLAVLAFVFGWLSIRTQGVFLGINDLAWYWNALILGVLAISIKLDCHSCGVCGIGGPKMS